MTDGLGKVRRRARRKDPIAHAVSEVKAVNWRELSIWLIAAGSRGGSVSVICWAGIAAIVVVDGQL